MEDENEAYSNILNFSHETSYIVMETIAFKSINCIKFMPCKVASDRLSMENILTLS